ncbi:MAG: cation diffusion facilitator family transporter [Alphaproteobacteria bacterium]|nr:cation diffusion facilitator family transporter [Alphaproteobacteria bacterium]
MNSSRDAKLKNLAATASILTSLLLTIIKAGAAFMTGSLSILSSMVDSLSDVVSSAITFVAVKFSDKPLNTKHRYGYGKAESVSALLQSAFIVGSAGFILYDGIYHFIKPAQIENTTAGLVVMFISLAATLALVVLQKYVIKRTKSIAIAADSLHYMVDILSNSAVILSLTLVRYLHLYWIDVMTAILIALYLLYNAWDITCEALGEITDCELDDKIKQKIIALAASSEGVMGVHDMRSRVSGSRFFIELHLEFDGNMTLYQTHHLAEQAEEKILKQFPQAQIIVHQDPYGVEEKRLDDHV